MNIAIFDSDEDEIMENNPRLRRPKRFTNRTNYFEEFDQLEFFVRFRLQKRTCQILLETIEDFLRSPTNRNNAISLSTKLLLTLRFYATGSILVVMGDFVGVSKSSACVAVKQVTEAIARLHNTYICFPATEAEQQETKRKFYQIARFPNVIGTIDCTHIRMQSPGGDQAESFRNRKGFFSWNVQTVCDASYVLWILLWPGSAHDQTIFNNSRLKARLEANEFGNSLLLGDSGYVQTNYLITPLANPNTPVENLFNESQIRTRNCVERSYGVWKRRFSILSLGMRISLERSQAVVAATAVLHNLAILENDGEPPEEIVVDQNNVRVQEVHQVVQYERNANRMIISLINNQFANLL